MIDTPSIFCHTAQCLVNKHGLNDSGLGFCFSDFNPTSTIPG